jgi:hypothetical protein
VKVADQLITDRYAIYNGDCMEVLASLPDDSIHLSIYSPPFAGLYQYSSSERDLSNARNYDEFFEHYEHIVRELARITLPGRITAVHCMDVPTGNTGCDALIDFPGDIIRMHAKLGFDFITRRAIWKEPLTVRNRTLAKGLAHRTIVGRRLPRLGRLGGLPARVPAEGREPHPGQPRTRAAGVCRRSQDAARHHPVSWMDRQADREPLFTLDLAAVCVLVLG